MHAKAKHVMSWYASKLPEVRITSLLVSSVFYCWCPSAAYSLSPITVTVRVSWGRKNYVQALSINDLWKSASPPHYSPPLFFFCRCGRVRDQHPQLSAQRALCEHSEFICMRVVGRFSGRLPAEEQCLRGWVNCSWCTSLSQFTQKSIPEPLK